MCLRTCTTTTNSCVNIQNCGSGAFKICKIANKGKSSLNIPEEQVGVCCHLQTERSTAPITTAAVLAAAAETFSPVAADAYRQ